MFTLIAMAATAAATTPEVGNTPYAIFGGLVALAILLGKILEKGYEHLIKKNEEQSPSVVKLDPDTLRLFGGLQKDVEQAHKILEDHIEEERMTVEMLRDNTSCLKDITRINERLVKHFDERMDQVDVNLRYVQDEVMKMRRAS